MRLVIAEPNPALSDILSFVAKRRGHQSVCVPDAERIFGSLPFTPTVAILSFSELNAESLDTVERLRGEFPDLPLLVTTETANEPMPAKLMMAGAQDVIQIPYNPHEVILRAESRHVAAGAAVDPDAVTVGDLAVNLAGYVAQKNGQPLSLTKLELRLLFCLGNHSPNVAPSERLLAFGWESTADEPPDMALLKTHISHLRKKMKEAGGQSISIVSRQSIGYQLSTDAA
jgi:DNA-binding response OmpR family regulator